jgi:hypothetical protein
MLAYGKGRVGLILADASQPTGSPVVQNPAGALAVLVVVPAAILGMTRRRW